MTKNPLKEKLKGKQIILASGSPRRKMFLEELGLDFIIDPKSVEEVYPEHLQGQEISEYLAELKATPFKKQLEPDQIVITSDTVVWHKNASLAKAADKTEAFEMLRILSGDWHEVISSVCFTTKDFQKTVSSITKVKLKEFTDEEINFYIDTCQPFDKAGAYGIQEWIGMIGISEIQGSYTNVVGLPTHLVYETLMEL
ncbi:Maf family nucleotide pyrophosphatase [Flagellimonas zhangzhouensis]|uniref:dTTP/UTP pyrophosphatase n=1 Tax=Flagellimonas zhangzhouensis TaxID=1073328 RepID=A0A1H2SW54_9FLAO|nr:Maf family nucleotide pyrophosphatase [Allomuricauda zhangzhouensis]SDQ80383.1 septum formation protein [Allomuricauda zhangzhouensis]SDW35913.1 septum formation protein [Allomuricauda zhangzhouensis]